MYFNQYVCAGNLTEDPVLRYTKAGTPWCECGISLNEPIPPRHEGDEWRSEVHYINWKAWGKLARRCADRLRKGDGVLIAGRIKQDRWTDEQTGRKREKHRIVALNVQRYRVAKGKKGEPEDPSPQPSPQRGEGEEPEDLGAEGDDVPF